MDRANAFTIEITDWSNSELWELLSNTQDEEVLFNQPDFKKDGIFWLHPSNVPKELFKYAEGFNWLRGSVRLWLNNKPLTRSNYRTIKQEATEETNAIYEYVNWELLTDIAPITNEQI